MKYLIIILLAFLTLGVQAQKKDRIVNNKIAPDSIATQIARVDTLKFNDGTSMSTASTGSAIYANNGLMMNADTVILGNSSPMYYPLIVKNELDNWQNILQMSSTGPELLSYRLPTYELMSISMFNRNQGNPYIQLLHSRDNKSFIAKFDSSGIQYEGIDTTLTTPLHLMTEAQTKREIAAAISGAVVTETDPVFSASPAGLVINSGNGSQFLANDGTYKTVNSAVWGNITGTLSNQIDLQNALDAKVSFPGFGTTNTTASRGDHNHDGVYQPVGSYLTENQTITLSGDVTGSGTTAITTTLPNIATAGTYKSVTVNAKGQVTSGTNPTTLAGYGITDALAKNTTTVASPDSVFVVVDGNAQRAAVTSIPYGYYTNINASGTGYNLTNTSALVDFSTTDPQITITQSGTWKINAGVYINYVGATVTTQTMTFKLRRTNNTAADVVSTPTLNLTPCTTTNGFGAFIQLPPFWYSTSNVSDILQLWGNVSATLGAGNIQVVGAWITAEKIVD